MTDRPTLILTITCPSWAEPIVQEIYAVDVVMEFKAMEPHPLALDNSPRMSSLRFLRISHTDGSKENFRMWDDHTHTVEPNTIRAPDPDLFHDTKEGPVLRDDLDPTDEQMGSPDGITGAPPDDGTATEAEERAASDPHWMNP